MEGHSLKTLFFQLNGGRWKSVENDKWIVSWKFKNEIEEKISKKVYIEKALKDLESFHCRILHPNVEWLVK